jgi:hypothetical protein
VSVVVLIIVATIELKKYATAVSFIVIKFITHEGKYSEIKRLRFTIDRYKKLTTNEQDGCDDLLLT